MPQLAGLLERAIFDQVLQIPRRCGAGRFCDGQVLVFHDLVGLVKKISPRFLKRYADLDAAARKSVAIYVKEVKTEQFPSAKNSFGMNASEQKAFEMKIKKKAR